jgi:hypothetical protein
MRLSTSPDQRLNAVAEQHRLYPYQLEGWHKILQKKGQKVFLTGRLVPHMRNLSDDDFSLAKLLTYTDLKPGDLVAVSFNRDTPNLFPEVVDMYYSIKFEGMVYFADIKEDFSATNVLPVSISAQEGSNDKYFDYLESLPPGIVLLPTGFDVAKKSVATVFAENTGLLSRWFRGLRASQKPAPYHVAHSKWRDDCASTHEVLRTTQHEIDRVFGDRYPHPNLVDYS